MTHAEGDSIDALLDGRWDHLVEAQPAPNPTLTAAWLRRMADWETGTPLVVTAVRGDHLVAAGAFEVHRPGGAVGPRLARWLGDPAQWFSCDVLVAPHDDAAGAAVVERLLQLVHGIFLPVQRGGAMHRSLGAVAPWGTAVGSGVEGWLVPLPPPGLDYARSKVNADLRRAERDGIEVVIRVSASPDDVREALERHFALHRMRWDGDESEEPRFSTTERHRAWYRRVTADMAALGRVRIVEVLQDGVPVAAELGYVTGRGALMHTPAHRKDTRIRRPGYLALLELAGEMERSGAEVLDLGLGAGNPGGPKARLGPSPVVEQRHLAARSRARQRGLAALLTVRERAPLLRRR